MAQVAGRVLYDGAKMADQEVRGRNTGCSVQIPPCSAGIPVDDRRRQGCRRPPEMPYVGRVSVRVYTVFGRVAAVCRCTTCAALRGQGHDNWRISVRHTLAPTKAKRPKAAEVGEGHAKRAHAPPCSRLCCKPDVGVSQIRTTTVLSSCFCVGQTVL